MGLEQGYAAFGQGQKFELLGHVGSRNYSVGIGVFSRLVLFTPLPHLISMREVPSSYNRTPHERLCRDPS